MLQVADSEISMKEKVVHIFLELKGHAPFTLFGAVLGIVFMLLFKNVSNVESHVLFAVFHPGHVVLSAMVTASMFALHTARKRLILLLVVGYFGSIGIATLSDVIIPHVGGRILGLDIIAIHIGFIEDWYIVSPAALLGVLLAYFLPRTKFPHACHVLISTWASSSYLLMHIQSELTSIAIVGIFVTLFVATWLPCCISDIIFPLLLVKSDRQIPGPCKCHGLHSHPHEQERPASDS